LTGNNIGPDKGPEKTQVKQKLSSWAAHIIQVLVQLYWYRQYPNR